MEKEFNQCMLEQTIEYLNTLIKQTKSAVEINNERVKIQSVRLRKDDEGKSICDINIVFDNKRKRR